MKKNRMMRSASALLVMVLLTTSVISGTFAKYVTTNKVEDKARVAKWGVTVDASGNLFGENYLTGANSKPTVSENDTEISVESINNDANVSDNVVAPGTESQNGLTFGINGTPEVDTKVSMVIEAKDVYLAANKTFGVMQKVTVNETNYKELVTAGLYTGSGSAYTKVTTEAYGAANTYFQLAYQTTVGATGYYPVAYKWDGDTSVSKAADIAELIAKKVDSTVATASADGNGIYKYTVTKNVVESNLDLATVLELPEETITWKWDFGDEETQANIGEPITDYEDLCDTILGDLAADGNVVEVDTNGNVAVLSTDANGIVKNGDDEVGCIRTAFNIKITVEQVD